MSETKQNTGKKSADQAANDSPSASSGAGQEDSSKTTPKGKGISLRPIGVILIIIALVWMLSKGFRQEQTEPDQGFPVAAEAGGAGLPDIPFVDVTSLEPILQKSFLEAQKQLSEKPLDPELNGRVAMVYHANSLFAAAEVCYDRAIALNPNDYRWYYLKGKLKMATKDANDALKKFEKSLSLKPDYVPTGINLGWVAISTNQLDPAEKGFKAALAAEPDSVPALTGLGNVEAKRNNHTKAIELYDKALSKLPNCSVTLSLKSASLKVLGKDDQAQALADQARGSRQGFPPIADMLMSQLDTVAGGSVRDFQRGVQQLYAGQLDMADAYFKQCLENDPKHVGAHINIGFILLQKGQLDEALISFRKALELDPQNTEALFNAGSVLVRMGSAEEGAKHFRRALEADPTNSRAYDLWAAALLTKKKYSEGFAVLREGVEKLPDDSKLANNLAWHLATCHDASARNGSEAVTLAEKVCNAAPQPVPGYLDTLAAAYAEVGQFDKAVESIRQAIELLRKMRVAEEVIADFDSRRALYASHKAYHQPPPE